MGLTFEQVHSAHAWWPIRDCPGRYVLAGAPEDLHPAALVGADAVLSEHRVATARDAVWVCRFANGGGLISYHRADGSWLHTLATADGLKRKLEQLGIDVASTR